MADKRAKSKHLPTLSVRETFGVYKGAVVEGAKPLFVNSDPPEPTYADYGQLQRPLPPSRGPAATDRTGDKDSEKNDEAAAATDGAEAGAQKDDLYYYHRTSPSETLAGISLRYGVSIREIRRHNEFPGNAFYVLKTLRIPRAHMMRAAPVAMTAEQKQFHALLAFAAAHGVSQGEARYYLENANWNLDLADAEYKADEAFETSAGGMRDTLVVSPIQTGSGDGANGGTGAGIELRPQGAVMLAPGPAVSVVEPGSACCAPSKSCAGEEEPAVRRGTANGAPAIAASAGGRPSDAPSLVETRFLSGTAAGSAVRGVTVAAPAPTAPVVL